MDQVELDAAYDQTVCAPMIEQIRSAMPPAASDARPSRGAEKICLRPDRGRRARLFPPNSQRADLRLHSWRRLAARRSAKDYAFPRRAVRQCRRATYRARLHRGGAANGDFGVMADQVRRGIAWAYKNAASFGGEPERFYIGGHSSGGHSAASRW